MKFFFFVFIYNVIAFFVCVWKGVGLYEIFGSRYPWRALTFKEEQAARSLHFTFLLSTSSSFDFEVWRHSIHSCKLIFAHSLLSWKKSWVGVFPSVTLARILSKKLQLGAMPISLLQLLLPFFRDESRHEQRIHSDGDVRTVTKRLNSKWKFKNEFRLS